jgi:putative ABC transport system permease protein
LFAFSAPILGLILAFITLVAGLTVGGQRNEIAVLRSRGASVAQVVGISLLEALVLAALAFFLGAPAGQALAQLVGQARSFLNFTNSELLPVTITVSSLRFGAAIIILAVIITVFPVIGAARHTIITYKQERARSLRPPLWQRLWLDLMLFVPAAYGTYLLNQQGTIAVPGVVDVAGGDPFSNPLLFLVPSLMMVSLTLFLIRLFPLFLRLLAWLFSRLPGTSLLLAVRQLSRSPGFYSAPMLLLVLTLSLATFTASLASTLDRHLIDQIRYEVGGDMRLIEQPESTSPSGGLGAFGGAAPQEGDSAAGDEIAAGPKWLFLPVAEHLKVDGVTDAARIGWFPATVRTASNTIQGQFLGVDRTDYPRVSFWRSDFSSAPLGMLMNNLAVAPNAVLIPESVMTENALQVGDPIRVQLPMFGATANLDLKIVGTFRRWPGWYPNKPETGPLFVGNIEHMFEQAGGQVPYDVWLKVKEGADPETVVEQARQMGFTVVAAYDVRSQVEEEQTRPERQGLFGLLSVGFGASALLTVLGFFLYAVFSFRRRLIELGMLRAIGLSMTQMSALLGWELLLLLGTGIGAGTALGITASNVYVPFMQVGLSPEATVLPFRVQIDWPAIYNIYALFGLLFILALVVLTAFLSRMKIFQAVKLGETE